MKIYVELSKVENIILELFLRSETQDPRTLLFDILYAIRTRDSGFNYVDDIEGTTESNPLSEVTDFANSLKSAPGTIEHGQHLAWWDEPEVTTPPESEIYRFNGFQTEEDYLDWKRTKETDNYETNASDIPF